MVRFQLVGIARSLAFQFLRPKINSSLVCSCFSTSKQVRMEDVKVVKINDITESKYMNLKRVTYKQNGIEKTWDYFLQHDSVCILIFDTSLQSVVMVKQFRPSVYMTKLKERKEKGEPDATDLHPCNGVTYELCAGIVDRKEPPSHIAAAEVLEETGYKISPDQLEFIARYRTVGVSGAVQSLFYAEVDSSQKVSDGGGIAEEGEMIDLHYVPLSKVEEFVNDISIENRPVGCLFALTWFLRKKMK